MRLLTHLLCAGKLLRHNYGASDITDLGQSLLHALIPASRIWIEMAPTEGGLLLATDLALLFEGRKWLSPDQKERESTKQRV